MSSRFTDFGDKGTYTGDLKSGKRHGKGKMVYDSGNTYEGDFKEDKFDGKGVYTWTDGDSQESAWSASQRHGPSIFRASNGEVEYSTYKRDEAVGSGVSWSADRQTAHKLVNGKKSSEITLAMAETIAKKEYGWEVPKPSSTENGNKKRLPKSGLMARMFASSYVDGEGNLRFNDYGSWGTYVGPLDKDGNREGKGKITYDTGGFYDGTFKKNKFHGKGVYQWSDGEEYNGEWKDNERHGKCIFTQKNGSVEYAKYEAGKPVGEGIQWSADRKTAFKLIDGKETLEMLPEEAEAFALEVFKLPSPPPPPAEKKAPSDENSEPVKKKSVGLFQRLLGGGSGPQFDEDGKPMFKDNGDWGTWAGELDSNDERKGFGTMTYQSGAVYEGTFVNNLFEDEIGKSKYTWHDGEHYLGQWKAGERSGKGMYTMIDGSTEYCTYEKGHQVGSGIKWSPDRKSAYRLVDGKQTIQISSGVAEKEAREKFNLPVPEKVTIAPPKKSDAKSTDDKPSQPGLFQRIFMGAPPLDEDGNPMFRDNSDWGSYIGEQDEGGRRSGQGKITYQSGALYEGDFVNNKYHGKGKYIWDDGDQYDGEWKEGERNGKGIFTQADGTIEMGTFVDGVMKGEGIRWNADHTSAWKLVDGDDKMEMLLDEAKAFAKKEFGMSPPNGSDGPKEMPGLLSRMFYKYDDDGNLMHKDHGEWGSYSGNLDENGKRTGMGSMTYIGGDVYKGHFVDDKYNGNGTYKWADGDAYVGDWLDGERNGKGIFRSGDGHVEYCFFENGTPKGEGVEWSTDRKSAYKLKDGTRVGEISVQKAEALSKEKFDLPMPAYYKPVREPAANGGFFSYFRLSNR